MKEEVVGRHARRQKRGRSRPLRRFLVPITGFTLTIQEFSQQSPKASLDLTPGISWRTKHLDTFFLEYSFCISYVNTKIKFFPMKFLKTRFSRSGFTLAEVMIAMGIVASVMVALLGMMPLGVRAVREATNLTICGRISQEVISNIQQSSWADVMKNYDRKTFTFDNEGFAIKNGNTSKPSFEARVTIPQDNVSIGKTTYNVDTLKKILVEVEFTPDGIKVPIKAGTKINPNILSYNFYVANQNKAG